MTKKIHRELKTKLEVTKDSRGITDIMNNNKQLKKIANIVSSQDKIGNSNVIVPVFDNSMAESNKNMEKLVLMK